MNTRELILDTLLTLEQGEEYSNVLIKAVLDKYDYLEAGQKAFIKRVTEGTLERRTELDYYLDHYADLPVKKMRPLIRCLMRMSVYQILYMDSVPDSAVCDEACKLAGCGAGSTAGRLPFECWKRCWRFIRFPCGFPLLCRNRSGRSSAPA